MNHILKKTALFIIKFSLVLLTACNQSVQQAEAVTGADSATVEIATKAPDFVAIKDVKAKKKAFFDFMRPIVLAENERVLAERKRMLAINEAYRKGKTIDPAEQEWLFALAKSYRISMTELDSADAWKLLKLRVDSVPFRLALAQSANESSWGTSRFAREGNNFFGQWCFSAGCGLVPGKRKPGLTHEVAKFDSVNQSVASYIRNLNRGDMYKPLRLVRLEMRDAEKRPTAHALAAGLIGYSERKQEYVDEIRHMIKKNFDLMAGTVVAVK
jgi:Bax protein